MMVAAPPKIWTLARRLARLRLRKAQDVDGLSAGASFLRWCATNRCLAWIHRRRSIWQYEHCWPTVLIVKTIWDHSSRLLSQSYYTDNINTCCDIFNAYHLCDIGAVDTAGPDASGSRRGERLCVGRAMRRI